MNNPHHHHPSPAPPPGPYPPPPQVHHTGHTGPDPYHHPPPQVHHTGHSGPDPYHAPPPPVINIYPPPPPPAVDHHHHSHHPHMPHFPPVIHHNNHHEDHHDSLANKPSVRVYSKAEVNYSLSIRNGKVILARSNPSDPFQHWIKDEKYSTRVKDEEGLPSFALINKATGQAMKHSIGATHPVQLIPHNPNELDESILWTYKDLALGDGYYAIRMVNNIRLNVDAYHGDKNHGGVHDGTAIYLWEWKKGDNQRWRIVPH